MLLVAQCLNNQTAPSILTWHDITPVHSRSCRDHQQASPCNLFQCFSPTATLPSSCATSQPRADQCNAALANPTLLHHVEMASNLNTPRETDAYARPSFSSPDTAVRLRRGWSKLTGLKRACNIGSRFTKHPDPLLRNHQLLLTSATYLEQLPLKENHLKSGKLSLRKFEGFGIVPSPRGGFVMIVQMGV
jgi:hypothetical protein